MNIRVFGSKQELGRAAAEDATTLLREAVTRKGAARVIAATGASQFEFLEALTASPGVDWSKVVFFHLDEYVGLPASHPASFRRYLEGRIVSRVHPGAFHFIAGDAADLEAERRRVSALVRECRVDVAFVGIGENGHLAFNDPPADFTTDEPYLIVSLDEACRRQQLGEGWFPSLADVPRLAVSMSVRQILKSEAILAMVPDARKANAVRDCLEGDVSPLHPASALRNHARATLYLDHDSAALLKRVD